MIIHCEREKDLLIQSNYFFRKFSLNLSVYVEAYNSALSLFQLSEHAEICKVNLYTIKCAHPLESCNTILKQFPSSELF